jgi:phage terminase large subunit-like protein
MSFDPAVLTGQKPAGILLDELHVLGTSAKGASAVGQLRGGMIAYPEAFFLIITTQSEKPPAGIFRAELMKARAIRDGRASGKMLPVLYEFPESIATDRETWKDPAHWPMITPNRGRSITVDRLVEDFETAKQSGEEEIRRWASQHLNLEIGLALRSDRWIGADYWEGAADKALTLDVILERSEVVAVGIDGGGADDMLGLCVLGRDRETRQWMCWVHAWLHPKALERRKQNASVYMDFVVDGDLTVIGDYPEDLDGCCEIVGRINESGLLACVGLDTIGLAGIVDALAAIEVTQDQKQVAGIGQGYVLTGAIKGVERKLIDGSLIHCGQPLMAWCVSNARVEPTKNAFLITKQASGYAKIDPVMAMFDAAKIMETNPAPRSPVSVYEDIDERPEGFLVL